MELGYFAGSFGRTDKGGGKMNKAFEKLAEKFASLNATFEQDDTTLYVYLSRGNVFNSNSKSFLVVQYSNLFGQSWLPRALAELSKELSLGVRVSTDNELEEYDQSNPADYSCQPAS